MGHHHTIEYFSGPEEIFRVSIRVNSSIYWHEQGFGLIKESVRAVSIFNNNNKEEEVQNQATCSL
jgi:hypothetical protein